MLLFTLLNSFKQLEFLLQGNLASNTQAIFKLSFGKNTFFLR